MSLYEQWLKAMRAHLALAAEAQDPRNAEFFAVMAAQCLSRAIATDQHRRVQ